MNFDNYREFLEYEEKPISKELSLAYYQLMSQRRTIREYSSVPVDRDIIYNAIRTAGTAPSGANCQPWYYVVVENPEIKSKIRKAAEQVERDFYQKRASQNWLNDLKPLGTDADKPYLEEAPYLILVFYRLGLKEPQSYYPVESTSISVGLLLSSLHISGLATLTHTPKPMKFLNEVAGLDSSYRPLLIVVTGKPKLPVRVPKIHRKHPEEIMKFI